MTSLARTFDATLRDHGKRLGRGPLAVLQINLGARCNLTCEHCHVSAGPRRTEDMPADVAHRVAEWIAHHRPATVDLTGGAPELAGQFAYLAEAAHAAGSEVIVRSNLTTLAGAKGAEHIARFVRLGVRVVASMPCYLEPNVDRQRGKGTYATSIAALKALNAAGYGLGRGLVLDLVYNPGGPSLPPDQAALEADYRRVLGAAHGIQFDRLLCLANMPVGRFAELLETRGETERYAAHLEAQFRPETVDGLMCRGTLNVDWKGEIYDCDFNQMLALPLGGGQPTKLWDLDVQRLQDLPIATGSHCFGCTAGAGSSCGGALV